MAVGADTVANNGSVVFGTGSSADFGMAVGLNARSTGQGASAIGLVANANGFAATAIGSGAVANGTLAGGRHAGDRHRRQRPSLRQHGSCDRASVTGHRSGTTVSFPSIVGKRAAQTGPTSFVTSDAAGNIATTPFAVDQITGRLDDVAGGVGALEGSVLQVNRDVKRGFEGSAIAMAMAGATLPPGKTFALSVNMGTFRGESGFAATAAVRLSDNVFAHGGLGLGTSRGGVGTRAGVTFAS
jgi:hypothetical protein